MSRISSISAEGTKYTIRFDDGQVEYYSQTGEDVLEGDICYSGSHPEHIRGHISKMCPVWLGRLQKKETVTWRTRLISFWNRLNNGRKK